MWFRKYGSLFTILFALAVMAGCSQVMPTTPPADQDSNIIVDVPEAQRLVDLRIGVNPEFARGFSLAKGVTMAEDTPDVLTFISNAYRRDDGMNTQIGAWEWSVGEPVVVPTLNGRRYWGLPEINGVPQVGVETFTINGESLHHLVSHGTWVGYFPEFDIVPNDSTTWEFRQGPSTLNEFMNVHFIIVDPAPADYDSVQYVGSATGFNNRFAGAIKNEAYGQWDIWSLCKLGEDVAFAAFGDGQLIRTKYVYASTESHPEPVKLTSRVIIENPDDVFEGASWFTSRSQLADMPVFVFGLTEEGAIEQSGPPPTVRDRIYFKNDTMPTNSKIWIRTNLANNGDWFKLSRSGGAWRSAMLNIPTSEWFYVQVEDRTHPNNIETPWKLVYVGTNNLVAENPLHHLEPLDGGGSGLVANVFDGGDGPHIEQEFDNLDIPIGGGN